MSKVHIVKEKSFINLFVYGFVLSLLFMLCFNVSQSVALRKVDFINEIEQHLDAPVDVLMSSEYLFVLDFKKHQVVVLDQDENIVNRFGERGNDSGELSFPQAMAMDPEGRIWIADTGNRRVQVFDSDGTYQMTIGGRGDKSGQFLSPDSIAIDGMGYVYVGDSRKKSIQWYSPSGVFLDEINLDSSPKDLRCDHKRRLYVLLPESGRIEQFVQMKKGWVLSESTFHNEKLFSHSIAMEVDRFGGVYIYDDHLKRVLKIDETGEQIFSFGSMGTSRGQFLRPTGLRLDSRGHLFIADPDSGRVQRFNAGDTREIGIRFKDKWWPAIEYVESVSDISGISDIVFHPDKGLFILSGRDRRVVFYNGKERSFWNDRYDRSTHIAAPNSLTILQDGRLVITDSESNQINWLDSQGVVRYQFGETGRKNGRFNQPEGIAVSRDGYMYICDRRNHRIQVFSEDGIFLKAFGKPTEGLAHIRHQTGFFNQPSAVAVDSRDLIHVVDALNKRVQIFNVDGRFMRMLPFHDEVRFSDPVDVAIDENDFVYVADRGDNAIKIFDQDGRYLTKFGSASKKGPGSFPMLTAVEAYEGYIYVGDQKHNGVQVFRFIPECLEQSSCLKFVEKFSDEHWDPGQQWVKFQPKEKVEEIKQVKSSVSDIESQLVKITKKESDDIVENVELQDNPISEVIVDNANVDELKADELIVKDTDSMDQAKSDSQEAEMEKDIILEALEFFDTQFGVSDDGVRLWAAKSSRLRSEQFKVTNDDVRSIIENRMIALMIVEVNKKLNVGGDVITDNMKIDIKEILGDDRIRVKISIPKSILMDVQQPDDGANASTLSKS